MSLVLLFVAGGQSVCLAADTWSYPTTKPETPFGGGDGSSYDPYRIETAQHLANLAYMVTDANTYYKGQYFVLTNDITLNDDVIADDGKSLKKSLSAYNLWKPIGEDGVIYNDDFMGRFDGCGHTIRGMVCICSDSKKGITVCSELLTRHSSKTSIWRIAILNVKKGTEKVYLSESFVVILPNLHFSIVQFPSLS